MKKNIGSLMLGISLLSFDVCARGGDSFVGGLAGGTLGGVMAGAMTRQSSGGSDDGGGRKKGNAALRAVDELEETVRADFKVVNRRISDLESDLEDVKKISPSDDTKSFESRVAELESSVKEVKSTMQEMKVAVNTLTHRANKIEDRLSSLEKGSGQSEEKVLVQQPVQQRASVAAPHRPIEAEIEDALK